MVNIIIDQLANIFYIIVNVNIASQKLKKIRQYIIYYY